MAIHVDIIAELQKRSVAQAATELEKSFNQYNVPIGADVKADQIKAAAEKIKREFSDIRAEVKVDVDRGAAGAIRGIGSAARDTERAVAGVGRAGTAAASGLSDIGKTSFQSARGLLVLGGAVAGIPLIELAKTAVTASQSIFLLPAAALAAGAGIGTLALATQDFAQTIKDIRDPKKFAADIQTLAPAAQQAALQIQNLLPMFDRLKQATEEAFFANVSQRISQLATTYQPVIQNMTTTIAASFNTAMSDVSNLLLQPGTQSQIAEITTNIGAAFQNAMPAVRSFTQAFLDIAQVGSQFLPGLGTSISEVAANFADFIRQARDSGQLHIWIQQGIDAAKLLGQAIWDVGKFIYDVFGSNGQKNIEDFKRGLSGVNEVLAIMRGDFSQTTANITNQLQEMSNSGNIWEVGFQQNVQNIRNAFADIPETFQTITRALGTMANDVKHVVDGMITNLVNDLNHMADILPDSVNKTLFGTEHPKPFSFTPSPDIPLPTVGDWRPASPAPFAPGQHADRNIGGAAPPGKYRTRYGDIRPLPQSGDPNAGSGLPFGGPFGVPPPPPDTSGGKPSDKDRLDAIKGGLDPSLYHVDPFAPVPGMPSPGALAGGPMPGGGYGAASGQDFFEGQQRIVEQAHQLEESRKDRLALERDNQSTAEQINDAKWKEHQDEVALQKAQADLVDKTKGTAKSLKSSTEELSAGLDPDLGLSKGLAGFADNMVRFAGHMALAGPMAGLQQTIDETEAATGIKGGYGLLGIQGANNLSQGLSPLLGNPLTGGTAQSGATGTTPSFISGALSNVATGGGGTYGLPGGTNTGGYGTGTSATFPPWVMALAQQYGVTPSTYPGHQETDRNEPGYAPNPQHLNRGIDWTGTPDAMQRFAQAMAADPLAEQVIYNGTTPVEAVAGQARPGYYADQLAKHGNHVHTRFSQDPTGGLAGGDPAATGYGAGDYSAAGLGAGGGGVVPVYVTNMGGGGMGGGGGAIPTLGAAGAPPGAPNAGTGALASSLSQDASGAWHSSLPGWDHLIQRESQGVNQVQGITDANSGGNEAEGLFQITPKTWAANGGLQFGTSALGASPQDQATIAQRIFGANPSGSDWGAGAPGRENAGQLQSELRGGGARAPAPGQPGYTPGVGYVDSAGNPTGYNPGASTTPLGGNLPPFDTGQGTGPLPGPPPGNVAGPAGLFSPSGGGVGPDTTKIGGLAAADSINPGGAGFGIMPGGTLDSLIQGGLQAAGGAAGPFGGGAGGAAAAAAAQTIMKLANRAIQFGGQAAGIGVQGIMDTFLPTGGSELAQNNWLTRIAGAVGAAAPALPNLAGGALGQQQQQGPLTPEQVAANGNQHGMANGAAPGPPNINITQNNHNGLTNSEQAANAIADNVRNTNAAPMAGSGGPPR